MRIMIVTDAWFPQTNGVVGTLAQTVAWLGRFGHEVRVLTPQDFRKIACPTYPEIHLSLFPYKKVASDILAFAPQALHIATEGPLGLSARRFCLRWGVRFTTSYHTQFPQYLRARFRPRPKDCFGLPRPIAAYVGRVAIEKNIDAFLSMPWLGSKLVIGDGPQRMRLQQQYPSATFTGYKFGDELASQLAAADVMVFPSRTDTFGLVNLEALACGVPVAAYPVTGPIDVIEDGVTGALDNDLGKAAVRALKVDPGACRARAMKSGWDISSREFENNLVPCRDLATGQFRVAWR
jgi:hypothetical protein